MTFLPWRFADAGPAARGNVIMSRHPKTFTTMDITLQHRSTVPLESVLASGRLNEHDCSVGGLYETPRFLHCSCGRFRDDGNAGEPRNTYRKSLEFASSLPGTPKSFSLRTKAFARWPEKTGLCRGGKEAGWD